MNRANVPLLIQFQIYRHNYSSQNMPLISEQVISETQDPYIIVTEKPQYLSGPCQYLGYAPILMTSNLYQYLADLRHLSVDNE